VEELKEQKINISLERKDSNDGTVKKLEHNLTNSINKEKLLDLSGTFNQTNEQPQQEQMKLEN